MTRDQLESWWLDTQGGRDESDVNYSKQGKYVLMSNIGSKEKVYLPPLFRLNELYQKRPKDHPLYL